MLGRLVNAFCFWLLASLAFVLFILAVIQRPHDEYQANRKIESDMQEAVKKLQERVAANEANIEELDPKHPNPLKVDQLAADILGWEFIGGREVPARRVVQPVQIAEPSPGEDLADDRPDQPSPLDLVRPLTSSTAWQRVHDPRVQRLQLFLAAVAISMAFIFFGTPTKRQREETGPADQDPDREGF